MDEQISVIDDVNLDVVTETMTKINNFQKLLQKELKQGRDFGVIPSTTKPTLLKPGAEKILMLLGISSEYEVIEQIQDYKHGIFAFTIKCILYKNGIKITEGVGCCSTKESKYAYKWVYEKEVPSNINKDDLVKREFNGPYGKYFKYRIDNDDPYTLANTVLKMAKKRAQVDAVLTVASLSEIFTQDIEDLQQ